MAITVNGSGQLNTIPFGQGGSNRVLCHGIITFTSTNTDGELPVPLRVIESIAITPIGTPDSDEVYSINETEKDAQIQVPDTGTVTILRTGASPVSGQKCSVILIGY